EPLTPGTRPLAPLLQVFDTYLLFQTDSGVAIVDQHSAHERVLYETVMRQLAGDGAPAQRLLLPLTVEFTPPELDAIEAHRELLRRVGYEIEPFSGRTVVVHTAPNPHPRFDAARCLQELVADLAGGRFGGWANRLERFSATFACRAAIKAGQRLAIGTRTPAEEHRARGPHLGTDLVAPGERYSAGQFARDASVWLAGVWAARQQPVVVGGTGFYVRALAEGLFREPPLDAEPRERLRAWAGKLGAARLAHWAARLDRQFAGGGRQRAARVIEVALLTGRSLS